MNYINRQIPLTIYLLLFHAFCHVSLLTFKEYHTKYFNPYHQGDNKGKIDCKCNMNFCSDMTQEGMGRHALIVPECVTHTYQKFE